MTKPGTTSVSSGGSAFARILQATFWIGTITLGVRLLGLVKNQVIAARFGSGAEIEAFFLALVIPTFVTGALTSYFPGALVPAYVYERDRVGRAETNRLVARLFGGFLLVLLAACVFVGAFWPLALPRLARGFDAASVALSERLFLWLIPAILIRGVAGFYGALQRAEKRFLLAATAPGFISVSVALAALFLAPERGAFALVTGYLIGTLCEATLLAVAWKRGGGLLLPARPGASENEKRVLAQYVPAAAGGVLMGSAIVIDQSMAATLEQGSVAALNYADVVVSGILSVGASALGQVVLPHLSELGSRRDVAGIRAHLRFFSRLILALSIPVTAILVLASTPLVALLYQRGEFTADDTVQVAGVLRLYFLKVPFFTLAILFMRALSALHGNPFILKLGVVSVILNVVLNWILMRTMGVQGIALSTALVLLVTALVLWVGILRRLARLEQMPAG